MARIWLGQIERALVVEKPDKVLDPLLVERGMQVVRKDSSPGEDDLIELLRAHRTQVLFKRSKVEVTRRVVEACPDLLAVQLCCIGDDSVDKEAAAEHGLLVFNDPVSNGRSVVEMVVAHLIALSRRLYETDRACRAGEWDKSSTERYEVQGKVIGVLGLGNIGRQVARAAEGLGMKVVFFDDRDVPVELGQELGWQFVPTVDELFRVSDFVSVHLSAANIDGTSNAGLLEDKLALLGQDRGAGSPRIFINLSRGFLHSAEALLAAVAAGQVRRAAVDVYPDEPQLDAPWTNPYEREPRIAVTPHIGAATLEAQPRIARRVADTFGDFSQWGSVRDCVYAPRLKLSLQDEAAGEGAALLAVVHGTTRGTKKAIDDAIFQAGASNLSSVHRDFAHLGVAYDLALLDHALDQGQIEALVDNARTLTGDPRAIRSVRQIPVLR